MTKEDLTPLFEAIAACPEDDGLRFVYADALLENGDELGELIQLQCRIASYGKNLPTTKVRAREAELRRRVEERLQALGIEGPVVWDRGFVASLATRAGVLATHFFTIFAHAPLLRTLRVTEARTETVIGLAALPRASLRHLLLDGWLDDSGASALASSPALMGLESLAITGVGTVQALLVEGAFPALRRLDLRGNIFRASALEAVLAWPGLSRLLTLDLDDTDSDDDLRQTLVAIVAENVERDRTSVQARERGGANVG